MLQSVCLYLQVRMSGRGHVWSKVWSLVCLKVHDASNGAHRRMEGPPLCITPVFTLLQQVLAPPVVWMLIEDPDAIVDMSRLDVPVAPAVQQVGQIFAKLHHLATEVWTFIYADPVPAGGLEHQTRHVLTSEL